MNLQKTTPGITYRIRLKGMLNRATVDWLGDLIIIARERDETLLIGEFADQPALRGLLDQLWNLNFTVLSVERLEGSE